MLEAGIPFAVVSAIMGWSAGNTILMAKRRYGHIGQKAFADAVNALDDHTASSNGKKRLLRKKVAES